MKATTKRNYSLPEKRTKNCKGSLSAAREKKQIMCVLFFFKKKREKISNKQTQLVCFHPTLRAKKNSWLLLFLLPENTVGNDHHFHLFFSVMCLKDENNFITFYYKCSFYFSLFPFFTHNNGHLHRRIICFTR